jgi:hypothetical protein
LTAPVTCRATTQTADNDFSFQAKQKNDRSGADATDASMI